MDILYLPNITWSCRKKHPSKYLLFIWRHFFAPKRSDISFGRKKYEI